VALEGPRDDGRVRRRGRLAAVLLATGSLLGACGSSSSGSSAADALAAAPVPASLTVTSTAFTDGTPIPARYSCDGDGLSPPLAWTGGPTGAVELALVVDDPDAPSGTYVHWVLYGLDPSTTTLAEHVPPSGARQARNSAGHVGYAPPCPPRGDGPHHYRFAVYALGRRVDAADGAARDTVLRAIRGAAVARGTITGTYERR
jgi:Raf kinase inhibitor-like YbhB/YbcL family protein